MTTIEELIHKKYDSEIAHASRWLDDMPSEDGFIGLLALRLLEARKAVSADSAIPEEDMELCVQSWLNTRFEVMLLAMLNQGLLACRGLPDDLEWCLTDKGNTLGTKIKRSRNRSAD